MLDTATKRRIDTARDILVGKVPDPKSQVEQITIALIYKFMDDMDAESEEFGGKRTFFADEFARYGWARLMRSGLGGHETLNLYAEAITKMPENPGIPALFRDIFKNAYLPYRDPETLRAFLKIIDEFTYDHSERLGDAFEYLLSVLGSQGDAGQFRTPRHIIDFIVAIVDPKKHETVLDPACGTAGFLISAYKHILKANRDVEGNSTLTPDENGRLAKNITGYDISPDMVRLSLVNLYLHGFINPRIEEYDTLTSQDKWNEYADVILANPPFMSPKGGIKPHNRFSVQSKRSEVLFVDYMAEHLTPMGRAGIIVPEGIIFQSGSAYKQLREMLIRESLIGVISLPSGVFQPYTGVKTCILILDKQMAKKTPNIMFSSIQAIGVSLGMRRVPTERNDLPYIVKDYVALYAGTTLSQHSWLAERETVLVNECNLSGERYRPSSLSGETRLVRLGDICSLTKGTASSTKTDSGPYPLIVTAEERLTSATYQFESDAVCVPLISSTGHGRASIKRVHYASGKFALANLLAAVQPLDQQELDTKFLFLVLKLQKDSIAVLMKGAANVSMKVEDLAGFQIPLPSLDVQKQIVAEIEGYQNVINGAHAVLNNYRPHIPIHSEWPMVQLADVCETITDGDHQPPPKSFEGIPFVTISNIDDNHELDFSKTFFVSEDYYIKLNPSRKPRKGDILYTVTGSYGIPVLVKSNRRFCFQRHIALIRPALQIDRGFLHHLLASTFVRQQADKTATGVAQKTVSLNSLRKFLIPLPPLATQQQIIAEIEAEQALVAANRELIARFEQKIQAVLARVWGEDAPEITAVSTLGDALELGDHPPRTLQESAGAGA
jgi:type I restriction enzyme M protein